MLPADGCGVQHLSDSSTGVRPGAGGGKANSGVSLMLSADPP